MFHAYTYDDLNRELRRGDELVKTDPQHLDLLALFLARPGEVLSRQEIIDAVWEGRVIADNVLTVAIAKLRKVLGDGEYIENRYGRGYRFMPQVTRVHSAARAVASNTQETCRSHAAPMVGRVDALEQLMAAALEAKLGHGSLCIVSGEPGIGKTRLAEALEHRARELVFSAAWGRCQSDVSAPPLWPVQQIVRELSGHGHSEAPPATSASEQASPSPGSLGDASRRLFKSLSCSASVEHRTLDELTQRLFRASKPVPLLLLLDDLQWADAASLRLLTYLVDEIARWPMIVVATLRNGELPAGQRERELSRLWTHRNCRRIELARLHPRDVDEYVSAVYGGPAPELSHAVFTRSEGNPFFMIDLLRGVERGAPIAGSQLQPSGLALDVVRSRLEGLPESSRRVLSAAAILGRDFDIGLLAHVSEREPDELLAALDSSLANDTVVPSSEIAGGYAFDHELIREVLTTDLSTVERCRLHLRAGEGLLQRRATSGLVTHAELAHHFLSAQPQGDVERAISHAQAAAADASRLAAHADARAVLRRALEIQRFSIAPKPATQAALLLQLAMVERILGDAAYEEHLRVAVSLARQHRLGALLTLCGQLLSPAPGLIAPAEAVDVLEAARDILAPDDCEHRAIVLAHLAWTPPNCHSARRVQALIDEAASGARSTSHPGAKAAVRDAQLFFSAGPDTQERAEAIAREIDRDLLENPGSGPQSRRMTVASVRLIMALQRGDRAAVARTIEARKALLPRLNNVEISWHHERMLVVKRMNEGDFTGVKEHLLQLRERASRLQLQAFRTLWALDYGIYLVRTGGALSMSERIRPSLVLSERDSLATRGRKLRSLVEFGLVDDVRETLERIPVDALDDLPRDRDYLAVLAQFASASAVAGSRTHCDALYRLLGPYAAFYAVGISFHCDGSIASHLGALAYVLGRDAQAREHLEQGIERERAFGLVPAALQTTFDLANLLLRSSNPRQRARAKRLLDQALRGALQIGMAPLASSAQRALAEA